MSEDTLDKSVAPQGAPPKQRKPYDPEELIGKTLADRYEISKCIGKGGMGVVYLAQQRALDRKVVVKVLPRSFLGNDEAIGRFEREARGMSRLQHPNIVAIYDFGHEKDHAFICMEYVNGETLNQRIRRDGAIGVDAFVSMAAQILQGIGEAHSMGLIHRDIKPSNIMLTERHGQPNYVKILDFGLAKLMKGSTEVTKEQALVGSTAFLSPEQILGNEIDLRVDIYAMGVLFYYMLSGEKPFSADEDIRVLYLHVHNPPPPLRDKLPAGHQVPDALVDLIEQMLAKSPADRPPDAPSILQQLSEIMAASGAPVPNLSTHIPSGEYVGLNSISSSTIEDPSGQLARNRAHTPSYSPSTSTPTKHPAAPPWNPESHSGMTFVTGEQIREIQKAQSRQTLRLVVIAALIIGAGFAAALLWFNPTGSHESSTAAAPATAAGPSAESVRAQLAEATEYIDNKNFGLAEDLLQLIQPSLAELPGLNTQYAAVRDRLATARLLVEAKMHEEENRPAKAAEVYEKILRRTPAHTEARAALKRLEAPAPAAGSNTATPRPEKVAAPDDAKKEAREKPRSRRRSRRSKVAAEKPEKPASAGAATQTAAAPENADGVNLLLPVDEQPAAPGPDDNEDSVPLLQID